SSLADMIAKMSKPRHIWVMVPSGGPTESTVMELGEKLEAGDTIIDGGNSFFKDDIRRAKALASKQIHYLDAGTSRGISGMGRGNIERTPGREKAGCTAEDGYLHCGPVGAGHFVKMVHNGIEYGIMQSIAEGFDIMKGAVNSTVAEEHRLQLPLADIAEVWRR